MRILFLSSWYPTKTNPNFGVFIKEHATAINTTDNEVVVLAIVIHHSEKLWKMNVTTDELDENGIRTVTIEIHSKFRNLIYHAVPFQYLLVKRVFDKKIKRSFNPDIIHSNVVFPSGIIGNFLAEKLKKPHVITEHWSRLKSFLEKPVMSGWGLQVYRNASAILPVSEFLKQNMIELIPDVDKSKFRVIPNVISSETFTYKEKVADSAEIRFCAVATWANKKIPDKIPELFIEALARLQTEVDKRFVITMIGGGDRLNQLSDLCKKSGLEAEFTGYLDKPEIAGYLQRADFFVHASTIETFGVVTAEALLCGTPAVCSRIGALPELINETNGILCENTVEDWVRGLRMAINTPFNHQQIATAVQHKFGRKSVGLQIEAVYKAINYL